MKVFDVSQIREIDEYTIANESIDSICLMERASSEFVKAFAEEVSSDFKILVFAGPGNNGGDALAIARMLLKQNYRVEVYLYNPKQKLSPDCQINKKRLAHFIDAKFIEITESLPDIEIQDNDIIIDGLFGSGLNKPTDGIAAKIIHLINRSKAKVYSIDIPSGLFGEDNELNISENRIKAYKTFTFQTPKLSFFFSENYQYIGDWKVLDIKLNEEIINRLPVQNFYLDKNEIRKILRKREKFAYKNQFGHALLAVGSKGKMGAAVLASKAVLKSGAGLLTVHIPARGEIILQTAFPEAMVELDKENDFISNVKDINRYSVIGIGSGIGTHEKTKEALTRIFSTTKVPLVLDADALNIIAENPEMKDKIPSGSLLTPHVGEFDRLVGKSDSSFSRLKKARQYAKETNCIVILKGAFSAICCPDGKIYFNSSGNPGMATAGSGDVLTGILTGLLAQSYSSEEAAQLSVFIHGLAGDIAAKESEESLLAGDIIDCLGKAFRNCLNF